MSENINLNDKFDSSVSGVERVSKKKGKKVAVISGVTAVALIGGGAAAYNLSDFVKNQVNLRVMKPENYYSWVIEQNSKNFASSAKEKYAKSISRAENGQNMSMSLKYVVSEDAKNLALIDLIGEDYRNTSSGEEKAIVDIFDNLSEISIGGNADFKDNALSGTVFAALNGENFIDGDIAFNSENYDFFLRVPELTEQWFCMAMGDSIDLENIKGKGNVYDYLTPEELEDIIIRYTDVWNKSVEDIEIEKKEVVDICDISVEYTVVSAEFTQADIVELTTNLVNELKNDSIIKNIAVNELEICTEDEYNSELDDIITELSEQESDSDNTLTFNTYIDPNGDIRGIKFFDDEDECFFAMGKDGDNVRGEFYVSERNEKLVSAELYADENNGKYTGNLDIMADDTEVSVEFTDYEVVSEDKGYVNAGVNIIIPDIEPVHIDFSSDGNSQDISYNINIDGTDYGTVILNMAVNDASAPAMPSKDGAFIISDAMNSDPEFSDYIPEENMKTFIHDILVKIGFSEELAEEGADDIAWELYDDYDDWETYDADWNLVGADTDWDNYDDFGGFDDDLIAEETKSSDSDENSQNVWNPDEEGMFAVSEIEESQQNVADPWQSEEAQEIISDIIDSAETLRNQT
ncbi:MAG: hypothetical protein K2K89_07830 [Ruminococcus sp.]|nr:hypothetical protein [Ruminococcus sp.]